MNEGFRVFVVDDDPVAHELLRGMLAGEHCRPEFFLSAAECLARAAEVHPDLFLIDINMPEIDGFEMCRRLKADWDLDSIPVFFMSGYGDKETELACYEVGGDDFILKPFVREVVRHKLQVAERIFVQKHALREQAGYAQRTAMSAMTSMGELGVVLEFLRRSFACRNIREVGDAVLDAMRQYDLQAAVQLRAGDDSYTVSQHGIDTPLEVSVLNHARNSGRIFQFKSRCVFNYGRVTLMVNNMPGDDDEKAGRIRDNGALLAEGADARLQAIEAEAASERRRLGAMEILPRINETLDAVQANYRRNCMDMTQLMIEYQEQLTKAFISLGLTEAQEEAMTLMARDFTERMVGTQDRSLAIVGELESVAEGLAAIVRD